MNTPLSPLKKWYYLKRIMTDEKNHSIIPFRKDVVHIGRSKDATYAIIDREISRSHALFTKKEQQWTLKNLSTNGLYVNKITLAKGDERILDIGHIIQLGHSDKFLFRFGLKETGRRKETPTSCLRNLSDGERRDLASQQADLERRLTISEDLKEKLLKEKEEMLFLMQEERKYLQERFVEEHRELERKLNDGVLAQQSAIEEKEALAKKLKDQVDELQMRLEKEKSALGQKLRLEEETKDNILKEKEELAFRLQAEKENLKKQLVQERRELEGKLAEERERLQNQLSSFKEQRERMEQEVHEREQSLKLKEEQEQHLKEEQRKEADSLKKEREQLLERLKEVEMDLEEKTILTSTLEGVLLEKDEENKRLEILMQDKQVMEQKLIEAMEKGAQVSDLQEALSLLEAQKHSLEQEVASVALVSEAVRKQVVESVSDVVENEFQCPICSELFYTAIMLNCSHTFCKFCIDKWKKSKKECPNCRKTILSETRSIVVDNFIEKIVNTLSDEMKEQRKNMIAERTAAEEAAKQAAASAAASSSSSTRRGRGGRQNRGRGRGRGRGRYVTTQGGAVGANASAHSRASSSGVNNPLQQPPPPPVPPPEEITVIDDIPSHLGSPSSWGGNSPITVESDDDSTPSSGSESSSISGDPNAYYGGYGNCFICGRSGHWAPGCPDNW